jgi:hypothetical protein
MLTHRGGQISHAGLQIHDNGANNLQEGGYLDTSKLLKRSSAIELDNGACELEGSIDAPIDITDRVGKNTVGGGGLDGQLVAAAGDAVLESSRDRKVLARILLGWLAVDGNLAGEGKGGDWGARHLRFFQVEWFSFKGFAWHL